MLGLHCCTRAFSSCGERGLLIAVSSLVVKHGFQLLWHVGSVVVAHGLQSAGSAVVMHGPTCSAACGIFPDQGSNPCPLHWQADSQPLRHQGNPGASFTPESALYQGHVRLLFQQSVKRGQITMYREKNTAFDFINSFIL